MKPAFHTSVQKERERESERNRQLRKWGSLSAQLGEKEGGMGRAVVVL